MNQTIELKNLGSKKLKKLKELLEEIAKHQTGKQLEETKKSIEEVQKQLYKINKVMNSHS